MSFRLAHESATPQPHSTRVRNQQKKEDRRTYTEPPDKRDQAGAVVLGRGQFDGHVTSKAMPPQVVDAFGDLHQIELLAVHTVALPLISIALVIFGLFVPDPEVVAAVIRALILRHAVLGRVGGIRDRPCVNGTTPFPAVANGISTNSDQQVGKEDILMNIGIGVAIHADHLELSLTVIWRFGDATVPFDFELHLVHVIFIERVRVLAGPSILESLTIWAGNFVRVMTYGMDIVIEFLLVNESPRLPVVVIFRHIIGLLPARLLWR